jgi:hypothetical protein
VRSGCTQINSNPETVVLNSNTEVLIVIRWGPGGRIKLVCHEEEDGTGHGVMDTLLVVLVDEFMRVMSNVGVAILIRSVTDNNSSLDLTNVSIC